MIERLKKFWDEFGTKEFGIKYVLPAGGLFFTFGFLGHLYTQSLTTKDLIKTTGTVEYIGVVYEQGTKPQYKYYPLRIVLTDNEPYRVHDNFKLRFPTLENEIKTGDTISIYSRSQLQTYIGWGQLADIYQIEKGNTVLFDIKWMMNYQKSQGEIFLVFGLICWTIYIGVKFNRWSEKKAAANKKFMPAAGDELK